MSRTPENPDVSCYVQLLALFTSDLMPIGNYEKRYLEMFKAEESIFPEAIYELLNNLFIDIDVYEPDETMRLDHEIGLDELRANARAALKKLQSIAR